MAWSRRFGLLAAGALIASGCALQEDLFNPTFLTNVGADVVAQTSNPQLGVITGVFGVAAVGPPMNPIVAAEFNWITTPGPFEVRISQRVLSVGVVAGGLRNAVQDCDEVLATSLGTTLSIVNNQPVAAGNAVAIDFADGSTTEIDFVGESLIAARDFVCGQVLTFILQQRGPADSPEYFVTVDIGDQVPVAAGR